MSMENVQQAIIAHYGISVRFGRKGVNLFNVQIVSSINLDYVLSSVFTVLVILGSSFSLYRKMKEMKKMKKKK